MNVPEFWPVWALCIGIWFAVMGWRVGKVLHRRPVWKSRGKLNG